MLDPRSEWVAATAAPRAISARVFSEGPLTVTVYGNFRVSVRLDSLGEQLVPALQSSLFCLTERGSIVNRGNPLLLVREQGLDHDRFYACVV